MMTMADKDTRRLLSVIRARCLYCSGFSRKEAHRCGVTDCPLWPYRDGVLPDENERTQQVDGQVCMFEQRKTG